jgi:hypothetical protein
LLFIIPAKIIQYFRWNYKIFIHNYKLAKLISKIVFIFLF